MTISNNLEKIRKSLSEICALSRRNPTEVRLIAVSKTRTVEDVMEAYDAGQRIFGENRVNEALEKFAELPEDIELHLIGHLQSNKAKATIGKFHLIHSVDSIKLLGILDRLNAESGIVQNILLQVNTSDENSKSGFTDFSGLKEAVQFAVNCRNLSVRGLMTIGPVSDDRDIIRKSFKKCVLWRNRLLELFPELALPELSMGMTSDFDIAIEEGATCVRIGSAVFGERIYL